MNRKDTLDHAASRVDNGELFAALSRRVAYRTESQNADSNDLLRAYLDENIGLALQEMGFATRIVSRRFDDRDSYFLLAHRIENADRPTVLMYGHGDVVLGMEDQWSNGRSPWSLQADGHRWYGRGTADNKGQHSINLLALSSVLSERQGQLGFNVKILFEMGEEIGSPGLKSLCEELKDELNADLFLASDGPRLKAAQPTVFLGSRGIVNFTLSLTPRSKGYHSGNWGGLLRNPATTLAAAVASIVDGHGAIRVPGLRPPPPPDSVCEALRGISFEWQPDDPIIDETWGEPGLTSSERVFGWNALEVLSIHAGALGKPVNAIPPQAIAHCQLRFVQGTAWTLLEEQVRKHLDEHGFPMVEVKVSRGAPATRLDPASPWALWAVRSITATTGKAVDVLPNLGGTLPNEIFAETLGLPTVWVPHSYPGCAQHAADEHLLEPLAREGTQIMAGLFWDLGNMKWSGGCSAWEVRHAY